MSNEHMSVTRKQEAIRRVRRRVFLPDFPHLPASVADKITAYCERVALHVLPADPNGRTTIPPESEAWLLDNVRRHLPEDMI